MGASGPLEDRMFFTDEKIETLRTAVAESIITMNEETLRRVQEKTTPKGDVLELARTAGVFAAKKTPDLIPYCHPLPIDGVKIDFEFLTTGIRIEALVKTIGKTGVKMEALMAATIAALTIYDMCKPIDKEMQIVNTRLIQKIRGKSDLREKIP